jgi:hypothetical protein
MKNFCVTFVACALVIVGSVSRAHSQDTPKPAQAATSRNDSHDFDFALGQQENDKKAPAPPVSLANQQTPTEHDGQHDFDFEIGTWKTRLWNLRRPLTDSTEWVESTGVVIVRKVWTGRANLVELVAEGPAGPFEFLNLRLYNAQTHQ